MNEEHRKMWSELGMDLQAHDQLLNVLAQNYREIYMSQENRPKSTQYFDFVMNGIHGQRVAELLKEKEQGRKIVGSYCVFVPEEIVQAANATLVGLCSGADFAMEEVEKYLSRNTCSLIKSSLGFKLGKVCPFLEGSDIIVGENTCDGKKKFYETLGELVPNMYVMDLPQVKSLQGKELMRAEFYRVKGAIVQDGVFLGSKTSTNGLDLKKASQEVYFQLLSELGIKSNAVHRIVSTGYGRKNVDIAEKSITEISCHAAGVTFLRPDAATIIDIGGQDSKAISINKQGKVENFVMNDKCAAGTGRFLEVLARTLETELDEFGRISLQAEHPVNINSMCTVFAESEVISLIAKGESRENIIAGIHFSIAGRTSAMAKNVGHTPPIIITGGVAKNIGVLKALESKTGQTIEVPENPQVIGALGAAVLAS